MYLCSVYKYWCAKLCSVGCMYVLIGKETLQYRMFGMETFLYRLVAMETV